MKEWIKDIAIAAVIAFVILQFIKPTIIKESSMEPNFYENNYLLISKQSYRMHEPERGDVIVFHSSLVQENGKEKMLIKRVIGLPGDVIDITGGVTYINGEPLTEEYTKDGVTTGEIEGLRVPEGEYFCMGDNRVVSKDSRNPEVGCVKKDDIVGKVFIRLFPFNKIGLIRNPFA